jgi:hypothetical protein
MGLKGFHTSMQCTSDLKEHIIYYLVSMLITSVDGGEIAKFKLEMKKKSG